MKNTRCILLALFLTASFSVTALNSSLASACGCGKDAAAGEAGSCSGHSEDGAAAGTDAEAKKAKKGKAHGCGCGEAATCPHSKKKNGSAEENKS